MPRMTNTVSAARLLNSGQKEERIFVDSLRKQLAPYPVVIEYINEDGDKGLPYDVLIINIQNNFEIRIDIETGQKGLLWGMGEGEYTTLERLINQTIYSDVLKRKDTIFAWPCINIPARKVTRYLDNRPLLDSSGKPIFKDSDQTFNLYIRVSHDRTCFISLLYETFKELYDNGNADFEYVDNTETEASNTNDFYRIKGDFIKGDNKLLKKVIVDDYDEFIKTILKFIKYK